MSRDARAAGAHWARRARASLREAQRLLAGAAPQALDASIPPLEQAASCLAAVKESLRSGGPRTPDLLAELGELRRETARLTTLFEHLAAFHFGWARLLCAGAEPYTSRGERGTPAPMRTVSLEG